MSYPSILAASCLLMLTACDLGKTDLGELDSEGTGSTSSGDSVSGTGPGDDTSSGTDTDEEPGQLCEPGSSVFGFAMVFPEEPEVRGQVRVRDASCVVESYELQSVEPLGPESIPHQIVQLFMACDEVGGLADLQYELAFTVPADLVIPLSMGQQLDMHLEQLRHEVSSRLAVELSSEGESLVRMFRADAFAGINICAEASDASRVELDDWLEPLLLRAADAECSNDPDGLQLEFTVADALPILPGREAPVPGGARMVLLEELECFVEDDGTIEDWHVSMIDWAI